MGRFLFLLIGVPVAVVIVVLAVANRREVMLSLDPFTPGAPVLSVTIPLYAVIFGALIVGVILGGVATWLRQGRYRRAARQAQRDLKVAHAAVRTDALGLPAPRA